MVQAVWFDAGAQHPGRLAAAVLHHLVVDGVSWRILVPDLAAAWQAVPTGTPAATAAGRHLVAALGRAPDRRGARTRPKRAEELRLWDGDAGGAGPAAGRPPAGPARDT